VQNGRSSVGFETVSNPPDCSRTAQMTSLPGESSIVVHDAR
jgi:hypothetical protein